MSSTPQVSVNQTLMQLLSSDAALPSNAASGEAEAGQSFSAALLQMLGLQSAQGGDSAALENGLLLPAAASEGGEDLPLAAQLAGEGELSAELDPELLKALQQRLTELVAALRSSAGSAGKPLTDAELAELSLEQLQQGIQSFFNLDQSSQAQAAKAAEVLQQLLLEQRDGQSAREAEIAQLLKARSSASAAGEALSEAAQTAADKDAQALDVPAPRATEALAGAVKEAIAEVLAAEGRQASAQAGGASAGAQGSAENAAQVAASGTAASDEAGAANTAATANAGTAQRVAEAVTQVVQELRRTAADVLSQQGEARTSQALSAQAVPAEGDAQQRDVEQQQRLQQALARGERIEVPVREVNMDTIRLQNGQSGQPVGAPGLLSGASAATLSAGLGGSGAEAESDSGQQRNPQSGLSAFQQLQQAYRGGSPNSVTLNLPEPFGGQRWAEGLSQRIVWMSNQQVGRAELRLDPPDLGTLNIRLSIQNDQASLSISSPHAHVREALEQQMPRLRDMLAEKGIDLQQSDVSDQSSSQQYASDERSGSGREQGSAMREGAEDEAENTALLSVPGASLSMVDYYA